MLNYFMINLTIIIVIHDLFFNFFRKLLGIITKKDILRHIKELSDLDPESVLFN